MKTLPYRSAAVLVVAATLAACTNDTATSTAPAFTPGVAHALLAPGEYNRTISDTTDAAGNHVTVTEHAAGIFTQPDGVSGSVASVTVRTSVPASGPVSGACVTSTVVGTETVPGWTATIRKPGGCDKEIVVGLDNAGTGQKAEFRYLYIFGKTRIDAGAVR